jgi:hypothetical protein
LHDGISNSNGALCISSTEIIEILDRRKKTAETARFDAVLQQTIGNYPYKHYSVIQGDDGGMENAMYLILGKVRLKAIIGHKYGTLVVSACFSVNEETRKAYGWTGRRICLTFWWDEMKSWRKTG